MRLKKKSSTSYFVPNGGRITNEYQFRNVPIFEDIYAVNGQKVHVSYCVVYDDVAYVLSSLDKCVEKINSFFGK